MNPFAARFLVAFSMLCACTATGGVGIAQASSVEARTVANAAATIEAYGIAELQEFHGHYTSLRQLVMPNPGFGAAAHTELSALLDGVMYFEFSTPSGNSALLEVLLDGKLVARVRQQNTLLLEAVDAPSVPVLQAPRRNPEQGLAALRIERSATGLTGCLNQTCGELPFDSGFEQISFRSTSTEVLLSNAQMIDQAGVRTWYVAHAPQTMQAPAPRRVLAWERLSKSLYHTAISLHAAGRICSQERFFGLAGCLVVRTNASRVAGELADQLSQWRNWRPFDDTLPSTSLASNPSFQSWDKGNWANGYLPYSALLFSHVAEAHGRDPNAAKRAEAYQRFGEAFLRNELYHERAGHWIKRSNNHGGIVLGNGYAAHLLANRCQEDELARSLRRSFRKVAEGSFSHGVYVESFTYLQVFVMESLPAVFTRQQCFGETFETAFAQLYGNVDLADIAEASSFFTTPSGVILVPYGDCCGISAWREDSLRLLGRADRRFEEMAESGLFSSEGNPAITWLSNSAPGNLTAIAAPADQPVEDSGLRCFHSEFGLAAARATTASGLVQAAISSTRLHLTHNKDWDLGAVYLAVGGEPIVGERLDGDPGRHPQATRHSTAWSSRNLDQYPGCFGESTSRCPWRTVNGVISEVGATPTSCTAKARSNAGAGSDRRWTFESIPDGRVRMRIEDYTTASGGSPVLVFAHFELPHDIEPVPGNDRAWRIQRDGWEVEISVDGYSVERMERRDTSHGRYASLDLASPELPISDSPVLAGALTIMINPIPSASR